MYSIFAMDDGRFTRSLPPICVRVCDHERERERKSERFPYVNPRGVGFSYHSGWLVVMCVGSSLFLSILGYLVSVITLH